MSKRKYRWNKAKFARNMKTGIKALGVFAIRTVCVVTVLFLMLGVPQIISSLLRGVSICPY